jgi:hypothetical protein
MTRAWPLRKVEYGDGVLIIADTHKGSPLTVFLEAVRRGEGDPLAPRSCSLNCLCTLTQCFTLWWSSTIRFIPLQSVRVHACFLCACSLWHDEGLLLTTAGLNHDCCACRGRLCRPHGNSYACCYLQRAGFVSAQPAGVYAQKERVRSLRSFLH